MTTLVTTRPKILFCHFEVCFELVSGLMLVNSFLHLHTLRSVLTLAGF